MRAGARVSARKLAAALAPSLLLCAGAARGEPEQRAELQEARTTSKEDRWQRRFSAELAAGLTPYGGLALVGSYVVDELGVAVGFGAFPYGYAGAVGLRGRLPALGGRVVAEVGYGYESKWFESNCPLVDFSLGGCEETVRINLEPAHWLNATLGVEWRWRSGVLIRPILGIGHSLNKATVEHVGPTAPPPSAFGPSRESVGRGYLGLVLGYAF